MTKSCVVPKCTTSYQGLKVKRSIFKVPRNIELFKKWQAAIPGVQLKSSHFVCKIHFEEYCINRQWVKRDSSGNIIASVSFIFYKNILFIYSNIQYKYFSLSVYIFNSTITCWSCPNTVWRKTCYSSNWEHQWSFKQRACQQCDRELSGPCMFFIITRIV